jgi:hypothetical protein
VVGQEPVGGEDLFGGDGLPAPSQTALAGLTLHIDFTSLGGSLYVRDYPPSNCAPSARSEACSPGRVARRPRDERGTGHGAPRAA